MPLKPIPRMMPMKPMRTPHTKNHQPTLQILTFQRLRTPRLRRVGTAQPHHTQSAAGHLRTAVGAREGGTGSTVFPQGFVVEE